MLFERVVFLVADATNAANGFLPTRGSWMLDLVSVVMVVVIAVLTYSIFQVRVNKNHSLHRKIQIATVFALAGALLAFEIDVRFFTDWRELAKPSPFYESGLVQTALIAHLCFAIPTPIIWLAVIVIALRGFKTGYQQGDFNRIHRICGRIAAVFMLGTAISGWIFYYLAFVA